MPGVRIPPSLKNIYTELANDLHIAPAKHGYLESWAKQGVLLLNTVLTVEQGKAYSHQGKGWEQFTDQVIIRLNARQKPIIFILWGKHAENKSKYIDQNRHYVLKSAHPSPLSAHQGFFGNKHFSKINKILASEAMESIHWELPEIEKVANRR